MDNIQWQAPDDLDDLDFGADCNVWGAWLSAAMTPDTWHSEYGFTLGANFDRNTALLRSALPVGWPKPTYSQAADWWVAMYMPDFPSLQCGLPNPPPLGTDCRTYYDAQMVLGEHVSLRPRQKCPEALCRAIARTSNPDLAGIGIMVSYLFEASFVTLFLLAYVVDALSKRRRWHRQKAGTSASAVEVGAVVSRPFPPSDGFDVVIDMFRHCVKPFFDTAVFFSVSMLVAAIYSAKTFMDERDRVRNSQSYVNVLPGFYDIKLALLTTLFSVFPLCILALISDQDRRRRRQRYALIVVAYVLCVVLVFLSPKAEWDSGQENAVSIVCDNRGGKHYWRGLRALRYLVLVLPGLWAAAWVVIRNPLGIASLERSGLLVKSRSWFVIVSAGLALVCMWTLLGNFLVLRSTVIDAAGDSDQSNKLGFGQVLALFAWAPVVVTFGYMTIFGPKVSYEGEMTIDYDVKLAGSEIDVGNGFHASEGQTYISLQGVK